MLHAAGPRAAGRVKWWERGGFVRGHTLAAVEASLVILVIKREPAELTGPPTVLTAVFSADRGHHISASVRDGHLTPRVAAPAGRRERRLKKIRVQLLRWNGTAGAAAGTAGRGCGSRGSPMMAPPLCW